MAQQRLTKSSVKIIRAARQLMDDQGIDAMLLLLDGAADWKRIAELTTGTPKPVIVAADELADLEGAAEVGLHPLPLNKEKAPLLERLQQLWRRAIRFPKR